MNITSPGSSGRSEVLAAGYAWEIRDAPLLHDALNHADLAHVLELAELDVLPRNCRLMEGVLELANTRSHEVDYRPDLGEMYSCREAWLRARVGDDSGYLHLGRTRREALRIAYRLVVRQRVTDLVAAASSLARSLALTSKAHAHTLMPDYTYLQRAQATTFGHYLLSFAQPVVREAIRLEKEVEWIDASPAGSGAANGSVLPIDRQRMAARLGFREPIVHLRDAMWQTDPFLAVTFHATSLLLTQNRLAEDLETFASQEFSFVSLGDALVRSSILMPHKRNPYALSVVRGLCATGVGKLSAQIALAQAPSARSETFIFAYGEIPRALDLSLDSTTLMRAVVDNLTVHSEAMETALRGTPVGSVELATVLSHEWTIDYRRAHTIVHQALAHSDLVHSAPPPAGVPSVQALEHAASEVLGRTVRVDPETIAGLGEPVTQIERRATSGGPDDVPSMVDEILHACNTLDEQVARTRERWAIALTATSKAATDL